MICPRCGAQNQDNSEKCHQCANILKKSLLIKGRYHMTKPYVFTFFRAVYQGIDTQEQNKLVSIREFLPDTSNSAEKEKIQKLFPAYLEQYKKLQHRNLASIIDFFIEKKYYYVIYQYVNGMDITKYMDFHKILRRGGYPEELVCNWIIPLCELFEYFHYSFEKPVFLMDFKPRGVVFRQEDEQLVFIDVGLSRLLQMMGPNYLAAEDSEALIKSGGKLESIGWDLFCLGNLIYYLLSGVDLLGVPDNKQMPISVLVPDLSKAMVDIVTKAVGVEYQSGYNDVRHMKEDLIEKTYSLPLWTYPFYTDFVKIKKDINKAQWPMLMGNCGRNNSTGLSPKIPVKLKWIQKLKASSQYFITASGNYVYALSKEGRIYAIEKEKGRLDWQFNTRRNFTIPHITYNGINYLTTSNREVLAIGHGMKDLKWQREFENSCMAAPSIYQNFIFVPLYNSIIYAINIEDGKTSGRFKIDGNILSSPVIYKNIMFVTSLNKKICAINIESEDQLWQYEAEEGFSISPTLGGGLILTPSHNGYVYALDARNGQIVWKREFSQGVTQVIRATSEIAIIITSSGELYCLNTKKGEVIWSKKLGKRLEYENPLCMSLNTIFVIDTNNTLYTIEAFTGKIKYRLNLSHPSVSQLIMAHQNLYMVSTTGHLVSFG